MRIDDALDAVARAVLYEGYALYPYRPSALKNQRAFPFGAAYPRAWAEAASERWWLRAELGLDGGDGVRIEVRCLRAGDGAAWCEERVEVARGLLDGEDVHRRDLAGIAVEVATAVVRDGAVIRLAVEVRNVTAVGSPADAVTAVTALTIDAPREVAVGRALASIQVIVRVDGGRALSVIDPPPWAAAAVSRCRSVGLYPIVVGDAALAAPIILPDRPAIAPESPGDFFDGTEMDEMLTLRVLTLTDDERREAAAADPRIAALLERTAALGVDATARLHGRMSALAAGARVRLQPGGRADAFDLILAGKTATVTSLEEDFEGNRLVAVTLDDDPGADLGARAFPGHRFFFRPDEVEVLP